MMSAMVMLGSSPAYAAQDTVNVSVSDDANNELPHTGRIGQRVVENRISADDIDSVSATDYKYKEFYDWGKCASWYYYNKLPKKLQSVWNDMYELCNYYLNTKKNYKTMNVDGIKYGYLGKLNVSDYNITSSQVADLVTLFVISNPQFYFIEDMYYYDTYYGSDVVNIYVLGYSKFRKGSTRYKKAKKIAKIVKNWTDAAKKKSGKLEQELFLHDKLCDKTTYDYNVEYFSGGYLFEYEQEAFTQSAYSALIKGSSVCSGYSMAYEMLLNACGIDAVQIVNTEHAWNRVRIDGYWYNVDTTWDDSEDYGSYLYFNRSSKMIAGSIDQNGYHKQNGVCKKYMKPSTCTKDSGADEYYYGTIASSKGTAEVKDAKFKIKKSGDKKYLVATSKKSGTTYYYAIGHKASVNKSRSRIYKKKVELPDKGSYVSVIAVRKGYKDSEQIKLKK